MAEKGNSEETVASTQRGSWRRLYNPRIMALAVIVVVIAAILAYNSRAEAPGSGSTGGGIKIPNLTLAPSNANVPLSSPLSIKIWADTGDQKVNAVSANLSYPIDKLNFVNVDSANSAFGLSVQGTGESGKVTIARGSFEPVSGRLLVATVNFTGANSTGNVKVDFTGGTALLSSTTNKDILEGTYGGDYSLTR